MIAVNHETSGKEQKDLAIGELQHSPSHVPSFNTPAEASNKLVPSLDLHNQRQQLEVQRIVSDDELLTTEQADFEGCIVNPSAKSNLRDLIYENPFKANQSAIEQEPRDSLMMIASAAPHDPFATRVVSLGPNHNLANIQNAQTGASLASLVELQQQKNNGVSHDTKEKSDSDSENENHSCEDEELVISPQPGLKQQNDRASNFAVDGFIL